MSQLAGSRSAFRRRSSVTSAARAGSAVSVNERIARAMRQSLDTVTMPFSTVWLLFAVHEKDNVADVTSHALGRQVTSPRFRGAAMLVPPTHQCQRRGVAVD